MRKLQIPKFGNNKTNKLLEEVLAELKIINQNLTQLNLKLDRIETKAEKFILELENR